MTGFEYMGEEQPPAERRPSVERLLLGALTVALLLVLCAGLGGEWAQFATQSVRVLPFVPLAVLAYYGLHYRWARVLAVVWLIALAFVIAILALGSAIGALAVAQPAGDAAALDETTRAQVTRTALGMLMAVAVGMLGFLRPVRQLAARLLPIDPDSFVHTVALVAVVTLALECFVPLAVTGEPALIAIVSSVIGGGDQLGLGDPGAVVRGELYGLVWMIVGAMVAVGYGVRRDMRQTLRRLGLVRPTSRQVLAGVGLGVLLVMMVAVLSLAIEWLWRRMGWPLSADSGLDQTFRALLSPFLTPVGALVLGLSAGLGEELAVRGVLQPRLGILLPNLLFTALHAFQYNWDSLLVVFILGGILGLIRQRSNTTTSVIVHGVYDLVLVVGMMAQLPLVGE